MVDRASFSTSTLKRGLWWSSLLLGLVTTALGLVVIAGWYLGKPVKQRPLLEEIDRVLGAPGPAQ